MLASTLIAALAASVSTAAVLPTRDTTDANWEITALSTHSPSGRPGNDLHLYINATINDPNTIPAGETPTGTAVFPSSTAQCNVQWLSDDVPWDVEQPCTSTSQYSTWTFTVVKPQSGTASGTENFGLQFKLVNQVTIPGQTVTKVFTGGDDFSVGDNLSGTCGGSGVCNWGLTNPPYAVQQTETQ